MMKHESFTRDKHMRLSGGRLSKEVWRTQGLSLRLKEKFVGSKGMSFCLFVFKEFLKQISENCFISYLYDFLYLRSCCCSSCCCCWYFSLRNVGEDKEVEILAKREEIFLKKKNDLAEGLVDESSIFLFWKL